ncbi:MAG: J domain-containing protein, partial [Candidatus Pacebacteria bacterium]|nr:J domain-containing protein [Candidatus Paceibacterota bacterium]
MASKDYYKILGVDKNASPEEIKKAYYKLAHEHHPDKGGDEKKFKEINEAYQVLSDKNKRAQYDRFGSTFKNGQGFNAQGFNNVNWEDVMSGFGGAAQDFNLEDLFDMFGGGFSRTSQRRNPKRGNDLEVEVRISLESILRDQTYKIKINKFVSCSRCEGFGGEPGTAFKKCPTCSGSGKVSQAQRTIFGTFNQVRTCPECQGEGRIPEKICNVC